MVYLFGQHHRPLRQLCRKILQSLRRKGNLVQASIDKRFLNIRQTRETKIAIEHHALAILSMQIVRFQIGQIARQGARHHEIAAQTSQFGGKHFQIGEIDVRTFQLRIQPEPLRPPQMPVDGRIRHGYCVECHTRVRQFQFQLRHYTRRIVHLDLRRQIVEPKARLFPKRQLDQLRR